jgi:putative transposase
MKTRLGGAYLWERKRWTAMVRTFLELIAYGLRGVLKRGGKFYGTDRERWWGVGMREVYRLRQAIEEIFRGLQQELGWTGHRHWRRARLLAHLALGLVAYGLIERQREGLGLSFYQCRRRLIAGKLSLDLSPLLPVQVEAA